MAIEPSILREMFGGAPLWLWVLFHAVVLSLLAADWFFTRNKLGERTIARRAYWLTAAWILAAFLFALFIHFELSQTYALEYLTGYGIEEALSIDNLFVFLILFRAFHLRPTQQRHLLFFGVFGAIVMRGIMIFVGIRLLDAFSWMTYIFGGILLYAAWCLLRKSLKTETGETPKWVERFTRHLPMVSQEHGQHFVVREDGRVRFTPLFVALIAVEVTDLVFATDSIPAVLAVSHHPFVVYSSNVFAILGLRSLYFTLAAALERLHKLRYGLVAILAFVGVKMMLGHFYIIPIWVSLTVLGSAITITAIWSLLSKQDSPTIQTR